MMIELIAVGIVSSIVLTMVMLNHLTRGKKVVYRSKGRKDTPRSIQNRQMSQAQREFEARKRGL